MQHNTESAKPCYCHSQLSSFNKKDYVCHTDLWTMVTVLNMGLYSLFSFFLFFF
jgi:hypothetical protein